MTAKLNIQNFTSTGASSARTFRAELQSVNHAGRWVLVPEAVASSFEGKRPAVRGKVNGVAFRSRLAVYGGKSFLGFAAAIRSQAKISLGDMLNIELEADYAAREVDVPVGLQSALKANPAAQATFDRLPFSCRKEYVVWIESAKRDETRSRRITEAVALLVAGKKTPR